MDSLTHIAIGACIGELFLGKRIGKKAMWYGAIAASLPDIDFISSLWLKIPDDLMAHRGITHSFLFALLMIPGLAALFRYRQRADHIPLKTWLVFIGAAFLSHLFLDVLNAYGIGWFEPFSHQRFSWNVLFVVDPFFSVWPGVAAGVLIFAHRHGTIRKTFARLSLAFSSMYILYCLANKFKVDNDSRYALLHQQIHYSRYFTTPAPFNSWLWFVVAEADSGYYTGYRSVFDQTDSVTLSYFPRNARSLQPFLGQEGVRQLIRFSQGFYTVGHSGDGLVFNILRFGQVQGWQDPSAPFVFHYYLQDPDANHLVVQRGRFSGWNRESLKVFLHRIRGR
jgi:inner membrane protein